MIYYIMTNAISWLVVIQVLISRARNNRSIILTKLALVPLHLINVFLLITLTECLLFWWISTVSRDGSKSSRQMDLESRFEIVICMLDTLKIFLLALAVEVQLLEWRCLIQLVLMQAKPENKG